MTRLPSSAASTVLLSFLGIATASAQAPSMVCGLDIYPSPIGFPDAEPPPDPPPGPSGDPCEDGETVFGPVRFDRSDGQPEMAMAAFDLLADANVCVRADASAKGKAFLYLDGMRISEPEDFDDGFEEQVHGLAAGSHGMGVRNVGKPGEHIDLEIRQLAETNGGGGDPGLPAPGEVKIDPDTGALDMVNADNTVRLQNVASDHPLLTPNDDGDNDTTMFLALTTPLVPLPGKDDGTVDYFLDWQFQVVNLDTCAMSDTGLSGMEQINSPTLVTTSFDGTDTTGAPLPDGNYVYLFEVNVVNEFGVSLGSITSPAFGLMLDASSPTPDFDEPPEFLGACNPAVDPSSCKCPGVDGEPGVSDPTCRFAFVTQLLPELGLPAGTMPNYMNPQDVEKSFITTTQDPVTGRYTVIVDLRDYNAGGLIPKARGVWATEATLRQWVSDMTGVPVGTGDSLFNFDYIQLGTSTGVDPGGANNVPFNHFFLDAMTDVSGRTRIMGSSKFLDELFNDDVEAPPQYQVTNPRVGDECSYSGNTDGVNGMRAKFCAYNTAFPLSPLSDLGVYGLRTTTFGIDYNNVTSKQDHFCVSGTCGVRTYVETADMLEIEADFFAETATDPLLTRSVTTKVTGANGVSFTADREGATGEDGVCANSVATRDGLAVRMDSADGAVPDSCVINGIF